MRSVSHLAPDPRLQSLLFDMCRVSYVRGQTSQATLVSSTDVEPTAYLLVVASSIPEPMPPVFAVEVSTVLPYQAARHDSQARTYR